MTMLPVGPSPVTVDGTLLWTAAPAESADPLYWVNFLGDLLTRRWFETHVFDDYYRGNPKLPFPTRAHASYRRLVTAAQSNWAELVVDAVAERLHVTGFRFADSQPADLDVWDNFWQVNDLDAASEQVHTEALVWGYSYAIVWPCPDDDSVDITPEHAGEVICFAPAGNRSAIAGALKRWLDDWGYWHATLYTPTTIFKYVSQRATTGNASGPTGSTTWEPRMVVDEPWPLPNPFGVTPVVEFANNPRLSTGGRSELGSGAIPIIDRINETVFNRLLAAQFAAFKQKWITGMEIPRNPETGEVVEPFNSAVDRLWMTENPEAKFGEFSESGLDNYINAAEADISHLASITRTPAYYLLPRGQMPSGESLKTADAGLVAKVKRRQRFFGESWEKALRLALLMQGNPQAFDQSCETLWANPEARSDPTMAVLLPALAEIGVPDEMLWEISGYFSPQQIERIKELQAAEPPPPPVLPVLPVPVPPTEPPPP